MTISICTDFNQFVTDHPEILVDGDPSRSSLINWSGGHTVYNGNKSMKFLTSTLGLDGLAAEDYNHQTSYEEIFGLKAVLDDEGNELVAAVPGDPVKLALYKSVWDYETADSDGNYPSKFFYLPSGYSTERIA